MKTKLQIIRSSLLVTLMLLSGICLQAQVTIGSDLPATRAALLELKTKQEAGTVTSVSDPKNATSDVGGLLLPRVALANLNTLEPFISATDPAFTGNTNSLKQKLAGLMVYNITNDGTLYPAVYTWNGTAWGTSQINAAISTITTQPKAFTFYETGQETLTPLTFVVNGEGNWTYTWYQVTGSNVHVRIGVPVTPTSATAAFTPTAITKVGNAGVTTRDANNNGFYKFYCVAESDMGAVLTSDIAEIAVGCGAKNNAGEWISFMCFNLGAQNGITIQQQKDHNVGVFTNDKNGTANMHQYIANEERVWGSLFQWGRIADGHENRNTGTNPSVAYGAMATTNIGNGFRCSSSDTHRPSNQVRKSTTWYGKFIHGVPASTGYNWTPSAQSTADQLWRTSRFVQNDPCAHYKTDGTYQEFWHEGTDQSTTGTTACTDAGTAWRTPTQDEWGAIYKSGAISGGPGTATANTWVWYNGTAANYSRGYEIRPDGNTTTLFLPASGYRSYGDGELYHQGSIGNYWSTTVNGSNAFTLSFTSGSVIPANSLTRAYGFALRCVKNS